MNYQPYGDEPYQRECADRYAPIKVLCEKYNRPFSVLDIGANYGWFGQQLVKDFPNCTYVGIDNKTIDPHDRIWHIKAHLTEGVLAAWSASETFDVVLVLSVLHHFESPIGAYNAVGRLGTNIFYEIPGVDDEGTLNPEKHEAIAAIFGDHEPIATFASHKSGVDRPMYFKQNVPFIREQSLDAGLRGAQGYASYKLIQDFNMSIIEIDRSPRSLVKEVRNFVPGMNLHNFKLLGGEVDAPTTEGHPDDVPWNYVIGDGVTPIDVMHKIL